MSDKSHQQIANENWAFYCGMIFGSTGEKREELLRAISSGDVPRGMQGLFMALGAGNKTLLYAWMKDRDITPIDSDDPLLGFKNWANERSIERVKGRMEWQVRTTDAKDMRAAVHDLLATLEELCEYRREMEIATKERVRPTVDEPAGSPG